MESNSSLKRNGCPRCATLNADARKHCTRCGLELWCPWSADFYDHPATLISLGKSRLVRGTGNIVAGASAAVLLAGAASLKHGCYIGYDVFLGFCVVVWGTVNLWAFTQGRALALGSPMNLEPVPSETNWRLFGLALSLMLIALGWRTLLKTPLSCWTQ